MHHHRCRRPVVWPAALLTLVGFVLLVAVVRAFAVLAIVAVAFVVTEFISARRARRGQVPRV